MKTKLKNNRQGLAIREHQFRSGRRFGLHRLLLLLAFCLLPSAFCLPTASAQQTKSTADTPRVGPLTYDSFRLLHTRNVFDPDRRPVRPAGSGANTPVGHADYLALTGTLIDGEKTYAFFSGSRSDFNKVLSVRDKIANATITQITPLNIVVDRGGKSVNVAVGQTVPLDDKSMPGTAPSNLAEVTATGIDRPLPTGGDASPVPGTTAPGTAPAPAVGNPPATSKEEIMRRMMEKRQQELR